jgi:hypothetical protein
MLATIIQLLSKDIEITVSSDRFLFKCNDELKSIKTKVYISKSEGKRRLLGIGGEYTPTSPNVCIELFKHKSNELGLAREECLEAFLRHAFYTTSKRRAFLRPKVIFKNSNSLSDVLCGYQKLILSTAAMNAGAHKCLFED